MGNVKKLFKYSSFFVSYTPLWISILYIDIMNVFYHKTPNWRTEIVSIGLIFLGYLISIPNIVFTMKSFTKENSEKLVLEEVQEQKTAALEYILTFVLPMFAFEFTQLENVILFALYFIVLLVLSMKHNLLVSNIVFEMLDYRFFDVTAKNGNDIHVKRQVVSRQHLENKQNDDIFLRPMHNGFWIDVSK